MCIDACDGGRREKAVSAKGKYLIANVLGRSLNMATGERCTVNSVSLW